MDLTPLKNEKELLSRIAGGDERAFTEVFHWYARPLGSFVLKLTDSIELTQEIIQDSFIKIWSRRQTLTEIENFKAYLYVLCRNHTFLVLKKLAAEKVSMTALEQHILAENVNADLENPGDHYRALIEAAVEKLPPQQKKVYMMSRYDRLKHDDIALKLNISSETVKKHIQAAVKSIQKDVNGNISMVIIMILTTPVLLN